MNAKKRTREEVDHYIGDVNPTKEGRITRRRRHQDEDEEGEKE